MQHTLSLIGDVFWIAALALMAGSARWAWGQIKPGARVPMGWTKTGEPRFRAPKSVALTSLVIVAFGIGAYLKVHSLSLALNFNTIVIVFLVRLTAAPLFAVIQLIQVRRALVTLAEEGQLKF
jgi:hypothetical protein